MAGFDDLIQGLHNSNVLTDNTNEDKNIIVINEKRQFVPGESFDTTIAYEGDINSQIITFKCVRYQEGHDLSACAYKELKWKNKTSGAEGVSSLITTVPAQTDKDFYFKWEVPAEACTQAGTIEISISIYDKSENLIAFSWNTSKYSGLLVEGSMESVGLDFPPKDEILVIDRDTKNITAPSGYNNIICNYGEVGVSEVYFLVDRYLGKRRELDVYNDNTRITFYITMGERLGSDNNENRIIKRLYTNALEEREAMKEGKVLISWAPPAEVTAGPNGPIELSIMIGFEIPTGNNRAKWYSNIYAGLKVGESLLQISEEEPEDWGLTTDYINTTIGDYLENNNFIIDANE